MVLKKWTSIVGAMVVTAVPLTVFAAAPVKLNCPAGTTQASGKGTKPDMVMCVKAGVPHGPMVLLYPDGSKEAEGQTENGFRTGLWTLYDKQGNKTGTANFKGGNFHGAVTELHPNGKVRKVEQFSEGLRHGTSKEFSQDGKVVKQTEYRENRKVAEK